MSLNKIESWGPFLEIPKPIEKPPVEHPPSPARLADRPRYERELLEDIIDAPFLHVYDRIGSTKVDLTLEDLGVDDEILDDYENGPNPSTTFSPSGERLYVSEYDEYEDKPIYKHVC